MQKQLMSSQLTVYCATCTMALVADNTQQPQRQTARTQEPVTSSVQADHGLDDVKTLVKTDPMKAHRNR